MAGYFAQAICQDTSLRFFEQDLEARKAEAFAGETPTKSTGKSRKETFLAQMSLLQNRQFASNGGF